MCAKRGLAAVQCLQNIKKDSAEVQLEPRRLAWCYQRQQQLTARKHFSEGKHGYSPYLERELIFLYRFTSPRVLTFLCYSRCAKGITLKIAGNNHLVPVQRVTDGDLQVLASVLHNTVYVTGKLFSCMFGIAVLV